MITNSFIKTLKYRYIGICLVSLISTGIVTNFTFLGDVRITIVQEFSIFVEGWEVALFFFIYFSLFTFFALAIFVRFQNQVVMITLIIHNLLAILFTILLTYIFLSIAALQSIIALFRMSTPQSPMISHFNTIITLFTVFILPMVIGEGLLIRRAIQLRNQNRV